MAATPADGGDLGRLGDRVRALREAASMSQSDLAEAAGLHVTYISGIERGRRNPSYSVLLRLARAVNRSAADLVAGH